MTLSKQQAKREILHALKYTSLAVKHNIGGS